MAKSLSKQTLEKEQLETQQEEVSAQIRSLEEREGKIHTKLLQIRDKIAVALQVDQKELPFVGELVQVKESESRWTGAIERLVHNFALCVLVPER